MVTVWHVAEGGSRRPLPGLLFFDAGRLYQCDQSAVAARRATRNASSEKRSLTTTTVRSLVWRDATSSVPRMDVCRIRPLSISRGLPGRGSRAADAEIDREFARAVGVNRMEENAASEEAEFGALEMIRTRGKREGRRGRNSLSLGQRRNRGAIQEPGARRLLDNFELMVLRSGGVDWRNARAQKAAIAESRKQEDGGNSYRDCDPLTARSRLRPRRRD